MQFLLLLALLSLSLLSLSHSYIEVILEVQKFPSSSSPLLVNITFINPSSTIVETILNWYTPLEGVRGDLFDIRRIEDGSEVKYVGMMVRRGPKPLLEEYTMLPPMTSVSVTVDITENYNITEKGLYWIWLELPEMESKPVVAIVDEIPPRKINQNVGAYTNCASGDITIIENSVVTSISQSGRAYNCLNQGSCYPLSTRWFGAYSDANYQYDTRVFNLVRNRLSDYDFSGYCRPAGCGNNVYAYVYPTDSTFTVYLCNLFWTIPAERVNTIIHEMSHFNPLGGTDDFTYGETNCLNLARTNSNRASHNADNVCYFAQEA